jgi:hypothetical protein
MEGAGKNINQHYFGEPIEEFTMKLYSKNFELANDFSMTMLNKRTFQLLDVYNLKNPQITN